MSNLFLIDEAYPLGVYELGEETNKPCRLFVNSKAILAIIPWSSTIIPLSKLTYDLNTRHDCYLLLVEGYYNHNDKRQNVEKYEITVEQFQKIIWQNPER